MGIYLHDKSKHLYVCLWICVSFVVKKAQVETNVSSFKVKSESGRVSYGSVICDYIARLGFLVFLRGRAYYMSLAVPFSERIIGNLSINSEQQIFFYCDLHLSPCFSPLTEGTKPARMAQK